MSISSLPEEVIVQICARLDPEGKACLSRTNTRFRRLLSTPSLARTKFSMDWCCRRLPALQWAHSCGLPLIRSRAKLAVHSAAAGGDLAALQWLLVDKGFRAGPEVCAVAAENGHLAMLQWLRKEHRCEWNEETVESAAFGGHLDVLRFARANQCPWSNGEHVCEIAAAEGHLPVLQWCVKNGGKATEASCAAAAARGHLGVLQWCRRQGIPWGPSTCEGAAWGGHLAILQYARREGCPWDCTTITTALLGGHREVVDWARKNGCPARPVNISAWGVAQRVPMYMKEAAAKGMANGLLSGLHAQGSPTRVGEPGDA